MNASKKIEDSYTTTHHFHYLSLSGRPVIHTNKGITNAAVLPEPKGIENLKYARK